MYNVITTVEKMKRLVACVATVVDEFVLKEGTTIKAVDSAHVCMLVIELNHEKFYTPVTGSETKGTSIAFDTEKLQKFLKRQNFQRLHCALSIKEIEKGVVLKTSMMQRKMSLIDTGGFSDPKVPNLNLPAVFTVDGRKLKFCVNAMEDVSDYLIIKTDMKENTPLLTITSKGEYDEIEAWPGLDNYKNTNVEQPIVKSMFPIDYFKNIVNANLDNSPVTIRLGNDYPIEIAYDISFGTGRATFLLAPRVECE